MAAAQLSSVRCNGGAQAFAPAQRTQKVARSQLQVRCSPGVTWKAAGGGGRHGAAGGSPCVRPALAPQLNDRWAQNTNSKPCAMC